MSVTVLKDTHGKGLQALAHRLANDTRRVLVGVPKGPAEADGTSIAMIAAVHEFGSPSQGIPERSFLRTGIRAALPHLTEVNANSLRGIARGTLTVPVALGRVGALAVAAVQRQIVEGSYVPLRPATIRRKGSSKPLIDTGSLRQSITYQIVTGEAT